MAQEAQKGIVKSKRRNHYSRVVVREQMVDALGSDEIEYELPDGSLYYFTHPMFRSDEQERAITAAADPSNDDQGSVVKVILGDQYEAFREHGGTHAEIGLLTMQINRDVTEGMSKRRPTQS